MSAVQKCRFAHSFSSTPLVFCIACFAFVVGVRSCVVLRYRKMEVGVHIGRFTKSWRHVDVDTSTAYNLISVMISSRLSDRR